MRGIGSTEIVSGRTKDLCDSDKSLALKAKDRFDRAPFFAAWATPSHLLAVKTTTLAAICWLVRHQSLSKTTEYGKILPGNAVGIIHMQINQLSQTTYGWVSLQVIADELRHGFIALLISNLHRQGEYYRYRRCDFQAFKEVLPEVL